MKIRLWWAANALCSLALEYQALSHNSWFTIVFAFTSLICLYMMVQPPTKKTEEPKKTNE